MMAKPTHKIVRSRCRELPDRSTAVALAETCCLKLFLALTARPSVALAGGAVMQTRLIGTTRQLRRVCRSKRLEQALVIEARTRCAK